MYEAGKRTLALLFSSAVALLAQAPKVETPVFGAAARLVEVNVVARARGAAVTDLAADDFSVFDNGKRRSVAFFEMHSIRDSRAAAAPLPPHTFSNRPDQNAGSPTSAAVVLMDSLNTETSDQVFARDQVIGFLRQVRPEERIAVYSLGFGLHVLQDFTSNAQRLVDALGRYRAATSSHLEDSNPKPVDLSMDPGVAEWLDATNQKIAGDRKADRARLTAAALETIANHIRRLPGRKSLIWVSSSFPFSTGTDLPYDFLNSPPQDRRAFEEEVYRAIQTLNDANVAVYAVDTRGLQSQPGEEGAKKQGMMIRSVPPPRTEALTKYRLLDGWDSMDLLAARTGGRMFYGVNDISGAIRAAMDDSEATYTLGFYPASADMDSQFHDLKVEVRRKGVDLFYRKGYIAAKDARPNQKETAGQMENALHTPLDAAGISMTARVSVNPGKPGARRVILTIDAADVAMEQRGGRWRGDLKIEVARQSRDGSDLGSVSQTVHMDFDAPLYERLRAQGYVIVRDVDPAPTLTQVKIVVFDATSNRLGSLTVPID